MHFLGDGMHQNVLLIPSALHTTMAHSVPRSALLAQDAKGSQFTVHGALTHTLSWGTHRTWCAGEPLSRGCGVVSSS